MAGSCCRRFEERSLENTNLIKAIGEALGDLRKSERKVADFVLADPAAVLDMRIIDLATQAGVSEPTVVRFCRALGYDGFQAFKLQLARYLGSSGIYSQFSVSDADSIADVSRKVFDATIGSLLAVREELDIAALERAIAALAKADRVEFYGFGASGSVAIDAQHKFFRLQVRASAYTDPHIQHMSAISLKDSDVVVAISQSGRSTALIQSVELAREAGATVIGLVPDNTPVAQLCTIPIHINVEDNQHRFTPVSSRIAHLVVIDVLAMGVAQLKGSMLQDHLKRLNKSLKSLRSVKRKK